MEEEVKVEVAPEEVTPEEEVAEMDGTAEIE